MTESANGKLTALRGQRESGFTLIEVMIVVVIVSILLAIALPSFQNSMTKGRRADGKAALMDAANRQERFMLDRGTYTIDMTDLGFGANPAISEETHYSIAVTAATTACPIGSCYEMVATPVSGGAQAGDTMCTTLIIDSDGAKTATGSAPDECW